MRKCGGSRTNVKRNERRTVSQDEKAITEKMRSVFFLNMKIERIISVSFRKGLIVMCNFSFLLSR
jgi:hypothetical protein